MRVLVLLGGGLLGGWLEGGGLVGGGLEGDRTGSGTGQLGVMDDRLIKARLGSNLLAIDALTAVTEAAAMTVVPIP